MYLIALHSISKLLDVMAAKVVDRINYFAVLDPLIKTFIQVTLVIGPLSLVGVVLLLRKIEKDYPERIRWN